MKVSPDVYKTIKALYITAKEENNNSFIPEIVIPKPAYNKLLEALPDTKRLICLWEDFTMVALLDYEHRFVPLN